MNGAVPGRCKERRAGVAIVAILMDARLTKMKGVPESGRFTIAAAGGARIREDLIGKCIDQYVWMESIFPVYIPVRTKRSGPE